MTIIGQISEGMKKGRALYEEFRSGIDTAAMLSAAAGSAAGGDSLRSELCLGDNVSYMKRLLMTGYAGRFDLIYIDPPFFTKAKYNATLDLRDSAGSIHKIHHLVYDDRFERNLEYYIENMTVRLLMMRDLLSDTGLMWVHLDWHSAHYIRLVMDELMGSKNFVNEIIWCYKSGGSGKKNFARKHDTILVYSKTGRYNIEIPQEKSYNRGFKPYNFKGVEEFSDENGWYTLVNMKDVWSIDMVGRTSKERTGYATQKPIELMKRIVLAGSREGGLVGDFFCGSGSLAAAAEETGRIWKCCDNERIAVSMTRRRLGLTGADFGCIMLDDERGVQASEDPGRQDFGRANLIVERVDPLEDGRSIYRCRLAEFLPEPDMGYVQMSDRKYVEEVLTADPLQLADYMIIEPGGQIYDGDPRDITIIAEELTGAAVTDVFGREYRAEILMQAE